MKKTAASILTAATLTGMTACRTTNPEQRQSATGSKAFTAATKADECLRRVAILERKVAFIEIDLSLLKTTPNDSAVEVQDWPQGETSHNGSSDIDYD